MKKRQAKVIGIISLLFLLLIFFSCGQGSPKPEDARMKLGQMGVKYNVESFIERIKDNDILAVKLFLETGMNPKSTDKDTKTIDTALTVAAKSGHIEIVKLFLDKGDYNEISDVAWPFVVAAENGHIEIVKLLSNKKIDLLKDKVIIGDTLYVAARNGHIDIVNYLLDQGADVNAIAIKQLSTALLAASFKCNSKLIKLLVDRGADVNAKDKSGETALFKAAACGDTDSVQYLLTKGSDINHKIKTGRTPLMIATAKGHHGTVMLLIEKGADVNARDNDGHTALDWANDQGHKNIWHVLKSAGAL